MSFAALVHGAHGITWYTYGGTVEPEKKKFNYGITISYVRWTNMTNLAMRISSLAPVLVERTPPDPPAVAVAKGPAEDPLGQPSVSCLLKRHADRLYVLAVNGTCAPVEATIALGGRCAAAGEVLWEDRRVTLANGVLADVFAPFAVHVYVFELSGACSP